MPESAFLHSTVSSSSSTSASTSSPHHHHGMTASSSMTSSSGGATPTITTTSNGGIPSLKTLLEAADLLSFEMPLTCTLHLRHAGDIEYVDENDLLGIGMSRPEQKRLRKEYAKMFPKASVFGKLKKALKRDDNKRSDERGDHSQQQHVIPLENITLCKELGRGEFGTVHMAYWTEGANPKDQMKVAVKCVSSEKLLANPSSFLSEAAIMHRMHHDDVVRLYGVVLDTRQIMIVSELASSGSLHACLLNPSLRDSFPVQVLCNFAVQIARGMAYLESQRLIHRDLAARNVLVFSAAKVKISDFGLSRSLGVGEDYYRGEFSPTLRLPIAWCAPECINYLKFTHSSDVWAYGVTLWEMFSYGRMPWEGRTGAEILDAIDKEGRHLARPRLCPEDMYALMTETWAHDPAARPSFAALLAQLPDRLPLHVRAIVTVTSAPSADHLIYNKDDLIYVIDKAPEECPDGSHWLGSLKNGRTGLFVPTDTVAHLGAEPPASNKGDAVESKREEKERRKNKEKEHTRERMKALISEPQAVRHTAHLGVDGAYFGLLQMDKKDLLSSSSSSSSNNHLHHNASSSSPATSSSRGEMSPASVHSSRSSSSANSMPPASASSHSPLSPPVSRAPSQPNGQPPSASTVANQLPLPPRLSRALPPPVIIPPTTREPTAPPLTPDLSGSDTWSSSDNATTSTSMDTIIGVPRAIGGGANGAIHTNGASGRLAGGAGGAPVCAVYARGSSNGIEGIARSVSYTTDDPLLDRLEAVQRDLTDFSICSTMTSSSTVSDTHPLLSSSSEPRSAGGWSDGDRSALRLMTPEEMERLREKQRRQHKKADKELAAERARSCVLNPSALPLAEYSTIRKEKKEGGGGAGGGGMEQSWSAEAQEAYRLFVECGVSLRESVSPSPSPRSNGVESPPRPPSLPPRFPNDAAPPARPPKNRKISESSAAVVHDPRENYDNLNGFGAGAKSASALSSGGAKKPPPVPPKPKVRITEPSNRVTVLNPGPGDAGSGADFSPSKDDYRADFATAISHSALMMHPKRPHEEVLRF